MSITSLSLTVVYNNTADMARGAAAPASAAPPVQAAASTTSSSCDDPGCDTPRRSPLFRALMGALDSLVTPAATAPAETTVPSATTTQATAATGDAPGGLDEAVMNFARALMQALRGTLHGDGGSDGEGHRHHHHDHGRRAWGDPAQRIAQLGAQVGTAAPAPPPATATRVDSTAPARTPAVGDTTPDPVAAPQPTPVDGRAATAVHASLAISGPAAATPTLTRTQQALLDAFGTLQTARGKPKDDSQDEKSLTAQLSAFLQELADRLRLGDPDAPDATQPGALLHVTA